MFWKFVTKKRLKNRVKIFLLKKVKKSPICSHFLIIHYFQGEYIAPEKCEAAYNKHPLILQIFVWGNSLQSCNVAVIVPDEVELRKKVKDDEKSFEDLCKEKSVNEAVLTAVNEFARKEGLKGFEIAKAIHLEHDPFTVSFH